MKSDAAVYVEAASALECIGGFCIGLLRLYSRYSPINNIHINNMFPTDPSVWPEPTVTRVSRAKCWIKFSYILLLSWF